LVEGNDLTVRGDTAYLKTLRRIAPVHAIFRRLDDDFCDPVELRADSALGVPGLIAVVRAGKVVIANPLGSGVLESAAWMGFIPAAAERLLGRSCGCRRSRHGGAANSRRSTMWWRTSNAWW